MKIYWKTIYLLSLAEYPAASRGDECQPRHHNFDRFFAAQKTAGGMGPNRDKQVHFKLDGNDSSSRNLVRGQPGAESRPKRDEAEEITPTLSRPIPGRVFRQE